MRCFDRSSVLFCFCFFLFSLIAYANRIMISIVPAYHVLLLLLLNPIDGEFGRCYLINILAANAVKVVNKRIALVHIILVTFSFR